MAENQIWGWVGEFALFLMVVSCWWGLYGIDDEIGDIVRSGNGLHVHIVALAGVGEYIRDGVDVVVVDDDDGC